MPEERWVACRCGYRTRIEIDGRERPWECPVCLLETPLTDACAAPVARVSSRPPRASQPAGPMQGPARGDDVSLFEESVAENCAAPVQEASRAVSAGDACGRCGRPFRGDWDRINGVMGIVCYVCANQAGAVATAAPPSGYTSSDDDPIARELARAHNYTWSDIAPPEPGVMTEADRRERRRQMKIFAAVSAVILLLVWVWPSEEGRFGAVVAPEDLPHAAIWTAFALKLLFHAAATVGGFYVTLLIANRLPNETLVANVVAIGMVVLPVWGGFALLDIILTPLLKGPEAPAIRFLAGMAQVLVVVGVIQMVYELKIRHLFLLVIILGQAARLALAFETMALQAIGGLVTL